jgi:hypothetical protein
MLQAPSKKVSGTFDTFILSLPSVIAFSKALEGCKNHNLAETR